MKDKPSHSYKYFAHKWVRSQTARRYISPYTKPGYPGLRKYRSRVMVSPPEEVVSNTSPPSPSNPRTRPYLSSLNPNPHQYISPSTQLSIPTLASRSRTQRAKRTRKNNPSQPNKSTILPLPIPPPPSPPPSPPQPPQDPRYSFTYILNPPIPAIHRQDNQTRCLQCLPEKVRLLIWNYARSRTISITISDDLLCSRSPSPITFRINHESRSATIHHYSAHPHFYILGTQHKRNGERISYPFFDSSVDSVVLNNVFMGSNTATSSTIFGFYGPVAREVVYRTREAPDCRHLDILQSLHIPARTWDWKVVRRAPRTGIRFRNLTEIVLEGGVMGLRTQKDVERCKEFIKGCFERNVEIVEEDEADDTDGMEGIEFASRGTVRDARNVNMDIKVPEVRVIMLNGLDHEWMFEENKLGMESIEERTWVMNFIGKVKAGR
ncbi:hypothetical protein BofuT4_P140590.1 [Botrytis cinerea T4]|uniref:Uncharacterized protein n=1 Tax=Botryotinia fuckeliana (strain T4) TaxID=999810 RepID=G2YYU9_BOTF4|nr:hypothetical protein BofuT4_P140590.1 [Botrytis cinerea T4]